jgi:hypothetical protein
LVGWLGRFLNEHVRAGDAVMAAANVRLSQAAPWAEALCYEGRCNDMLVVGVGVCTSLFGGSCFLEICGVTFSCFPSTLTVSHRRHGVFV